MSKIKLNKNSNSMSMDSADQITMMMKIFTVVSLVFLVFYGITYWTTSKDKDEVIPQEQGLKNEIIVGTILNQSPSEYYVLAMDKNDASKDTYEMFLTEYEKVEKPLSIYRVDLSLGFNEPFIADKSNLIVSKIEDIRFNGPALIYVKDKKIVSTYDGKDSVLKFLEDLIK